jgi:transposase
MKIIGCDFHPGYQQIAMLEEGTGERTENRLSHSHQGEEARKYYSGLVRPVTALAFALTFGSAERFRRGKQVASYFGLRN